MQILISYLPLKEVRAVIKDWRKTATELKISLKLLGSYSMRWDEL